MKLIGIITLALFLSACGNIDRSVAGLTGWSKTCIEGVTYIQFTSGATVQRDTNDKLVPC